MDAFVAKRVCNEESVREGETLLQRVYGILTKLVIRFEADE